MNRLTSAAVQIDNQGNSFPVPSISVLHNTFTLTTYWAPIDNSALSGETSLSRAYRIGPCLGKGPFLCQIEFDYQDQGTADEFAISVNGGAVTIIPTAGTFSINPGDVVSIGMRISGPVDDFGTIGFYTNSSDGRQSAFFIPYIFVSE